MLFSKFTLCLPTAPLLNYPLPQGCEVELRPATQREEKDLFASRIKTQGDPSGCACLVDLQPCICLRGKASCFGLCGHFPAIPGPSLNNMMASVYDPNTLGDVARGLELVPHQPGPQRELRSQKTQLNPTQQPINKPTNTKKNPRKSELVQGGPALP